MANRETSFADRLQRGRQLNAATLGFLPVFTPADLSLATADFDLFLTNLSDLNEEIAPAEAEWKVVVGTRKELVKTIKSDALRASSRVKSNGAWKLHLPAVKSAAEKLRGYRTPAVKLPDDAEPATKTISQGNQGFADIKSLLDTLNATLTLVPAYNTGAPAGVGTPALKALATQLDSLNKEVAKKEKLHTGKRIPRKTAFDGTLGLREKMIAIKESVKSQYGSISPEYALVKTIKV